MADDPVELLKGIVHMAEERRKMNYRLSSVRQLHETDVQTLERLISERWAVTSLLHELEIPNNMFDHDYKETFKEAIKQLRAKLAIAPKA